MKKPKRKKSEPKFVVRQLVYDRYEGYCDYARVKSLKNWPLVLLIDRGGNCWESPQRYLRPLTAIEKEGPRKKRG